MEQGKLNISDTPLYFAKAVYDFEAEAEEELSMQQGDVLGVLVAQEQQGWLYGIHMESKSCGYFPADYCERINEQTKDTTTEAVPQNKNHAIMNEERARLIVQKWWKKKYFKIKTNSL